MNTTRRNVLRLAGAGVVIAAAGLAVNASTGTTAPVGPVPVTYLPVGTYGPDTCAGPSDVYRLPGRPGLHVDVACGDGKVAGFVVINDKLVPR